MSNGVSPPLMSIVTSHAVGGPAPGLMGHPGLASQQPPGVSQHPAPPIQLFRKSAYDAVFHNSMSQFSDSGFSVRNTQPLITHPGKKKATAENMQRSLLSHTHV